MADALAVTIDSDQVVTLLKQAPGAVQTTLRQLIESAAIDIQREMIIAAPVGIHGGAGLRGSIRYTLDLSNFSAEISPAISYAQDVESGTEPHYESVAEGTDLRAWADLKGINPWALQHSIEAKGTKPHPYVQPTHEKMKPIVENNIADGISKLVGDLNSGRL